MYLVCSYSSYLNWRYCWKISYLGYFEAGVLVHVDVGHRSLVSDCNQRASWVHSETTHPATVQPEDDSSLHSGHLKDHQGIASGVHHLARLDVPEVVWSRCVQAEGVVRSDIVPGQLSVLAELKLGGGF